MTNNILAVDLSLCKYLSSLFLKVVTVILSTTLEGSEFQTLTTQLKKKCLASFDKNLLPTTGIPRFTLRLRSYAAERISKLRNTKPSLHVNIGVEFLDHW